MLVLSASGRHQSSRQRQSNSIKPEGTPVMSLDITTLEMLPAKDEEEGHLDGGRSWTIMFSFGICISL
jgi:hypothetical protein